MIVWFALVGVSNAADGPKSPPVREPDLRVELLRRAKADQEARGAIAKWMTRHGGSEVTDETAFETFLDAT